MTMFQPTRQAGFCWRSYKSGPSLFANPFDSVTGMVGQLPGACAQLQPEIISQAGTTLTGLQGLGVTVDAQTLCAPPTS